VKQSSAAPVAGALRLRFFVGEVGAGAAAIVVGIETATGWLSIAVDMQVTVGRGLL
jgi:hypothetical protein